MFFLPTELEVKARKNFMSLEFRAAEEVDPSIPGIDFNKTTRECTPEMKCVKGTGVRRENRTGMGKCSQRRCSLGVENSGSSVDAFPFIVMIAGTLV